MIRRLLIRPGAIGDFILSLPALESLRAGYTEVWSRSEVIPLVRFADRTVSLAAAGIDRLGVLNDEDVIERLRGFDSIVSWYGARNEDFRRETARLGLPIEFLDALPEACPAVDFYNRQAESLGAKQPSRYPRIECPPVPRTFAAIHPFASGERKCAPIEVFESVAARLARSMPVEWIAPPDRPLPRAKHFNDLYELACRLRGGRVYIGNDSGIAHLAAAVETPVLTLFRDTDPCLWTPRGAAVETVLLRK